MTHNDINTPGRMIFVLHQRQEMDFNKIAQFGEVMLVTDENIFPGSAVPVLGAVREVMSIAREGDLFVTTPTQLSLVLMANIAARAALKGWKRMGFLVFDARKQEYLERTMPLCSWIA